MAVRSRWRSGPTQQTSMSTGPLRSGRWVAQCRRDGEGHAGQHPFYDDLGERGSGAAAVSRAEPISPPPSTKCLVGVPR